MSRPYSERPEIPPAQGVDGKKPAGRGFIGCLGCLGVILVAGVITVTIATIVNLSAARQSDPVGKIDMADRCAVMVADWAGVDREDVTWFDRTEGISGWDFGGEYPGGSWLCGGPTGQVEPTSLSVFTPDGLGEVLLPRQ